MTAKPWEIHQAKFVAGAMKPAQFPDTDLLQIAFAGRSNVGKSSLLNNLVRMRSLARTSRTPGLTQQINFFLINNTFYFVDLPGYGFAKVPPEVHKTWQRMIESYLKNNDNLRLLVLLLDSRREPSALDDQMLEYLQHYEIPTLPVLTKCDKLSKTELAKARKLIGNHFGLSGDALPLATSAEKGWAREDLLKEIYIALKDEE